MLCRVMRRRKHWKGDRHIACTRLPLDLFTEATRRAKAAEQSMSDYLLNLVRQDIKRETKP